MRTMKPTLKVMLLDDKPSKDGLYPVIVRAFWKGRMERRTGISIPKSAWSEKSQMIKSTYPNAKQLNETIMKLYRPLLKRIQVLTESNQPFTVKDIFVDEQDMEGFQSKLEFGRLVEKMAGDRGLALGTNKAYITTYHSLCRFLDTKAFKVTDLNIDNIQAYGRYLSDNGLKNSTIVERLYNICNVWNYAISQRLVTAGANPFIFFNPRKVYKAEVVKKALNKNDFKEIERLLYSKIRAHKSDMSSFGNHKTDEFALAMYILGYRFGGMAFVDLSNIRKNQVSTVEVDGNEYYSFKDIRRQKTNHPVPVIMAKDDITAPLMKFYMSSPGDFLFPIQIDHPSEYRRWTHLYGVEKHVNNHLRKATGMDITFYSLRHSFATHYINAEGSNPAHLAVLMGRSVNGIFRYVQEINTAEDILKERKRMGL